MVRPSHLKSLQAFSLKSPSSSSSPSPPPPSSSTYSSHPALSYMKIKTLIHTLVISHFCRLIRSLSKLKSFLIEVVKDINKIQPNIIHFVYPITKSSKKNKHIINNNKIFFGSFRLHYNWCSKRSHVLPMPDPGVHFYYDATWNSVIPTEEYCEIDGSSSETESQLSGYLRWLEEKKVNGNNSNCITGDNANEIDMLAEMFIANCHEKFRLEKQESYRRFQEMLARSM